VAAQELAGSGNPAVDHDADHSKEMATGKVVVV
jgi:hypothetical protein